ncbi:gamma-glutamyl-gamma-aminobutyrate hydrolase family protein [Limnohabitans sp.]|uniref:gamma-glutamyl-gamma-aminobutyrate hydrolase family protein n=1 Tax=Limnohabitans sp. TaxID=1907725 RepID=UPI00286F8723|nr:gamma-glutamyl-gamma-aminobutyrate hydrolase family protein [Limnohabitans sp.]
MNPWVWVTHDHRELGQPPEPSPFTVLGDKYALAVKHCALAEPFTLPTASPEQIPDLLAHCDGVLFTGSPSNVHPSHYGQEVLRPDLPLDSRRDELALPLIRACLALEVPILGICRGFQEMNVALGGSLHQQVHELVGKMDHRESPMLSCSDQYAPSHALRIVAGSPLAQWAGGEEAVVNSLHGQGIDRLADGLEAMAFAPDGLVEAVQVRQVRSFAFAVQWHPEWRCQEHPLYLNIFKSFGQACRERQVQRLSRFKGPPSQTFA